MEALQIIGLIATIVCAALCVVVLRCVSSGSGDPEEEAEKIAGTVSALIVKEIAAESREQRQELLTVLERSNTQTAQLISSTATATRDALLRFGQDQQKGLSDMQTAIRDKVDERLDAIQKSNEQKLDEMRKTVDEKLENTLSARLKNSFDIVNQQLESVNTRLGEMRSVAESVANLNKVLSGSKTRGILGELQLSQIIEDMLPPQLYEVEAQIGSAAGSRVEYAIKLPGQEAEGFVYLPIDSKFPLDDYYRLVEGYEKGDSAAVDEARKALRARIKLFASSVKDKYVNPPYTTNFAVVFLPTEGLYAEAVRDAAFFEELRKAGIMLAGPTTLSALLSSLLVGFKTLQIQKGAVEVQRTLEKTKKEFGTFGEVLGNAQKRIKQTGDELDRLVGTRTRMINSALKNVQIYTYGEAEVLPEDETLSIGDEDE